MAEFLSVEDLPMEYIKEKQAHKIRAKSGVHFVRRHDLLKRIVGKMLHPAVQAFLKTQYMRPVNYPLMNLETRKMLVDKYGACMIELEQMIGRDLQHWINNA